MRPISQAVPGAIALLLHDAPLSSGKAAFAWTAAVGPAVDRATSVRLDGTVLRVEVASPQWAREIKRSRRIILARLQALLGQDAVTRLDVQDPHA
jgi:hypothetical protein